MESIVIGTAGHIDHGKTSLMKALTGQDTDTLQEEKRRGITVNLGFAHFALPCGKVAGIVDMPGHERFIKNMLAGASGIDVAMVVIAANEGVMPQTKEHIDILQYMKIRESVIVLTKIDMVDEEFLELVLEDTGEYLATTFLKDAPLFQVDSLSGRGIAPLIAHLDEVARRTDSRGSGGEARMNVDRAFSIKGFGTVVTGTLSEGCVRVDDTLTVYPRGIAAKVRGLQIHEQDVPQARAGQRTAMNLAGLTTEQVARGDVVAASGTVTVTGVVDAFFSLTAATKFKIKKHYACKMYVGAKELVVKIIPLDTREVTAGQGAYAQILLEQQAALRRGDPFVLRTISPVETIGGGVILDPDVPRYRRVDDSLLEAVRTKHTGSPGQVLEEFVKAHPFRTAESLRLMLNAPAIADELGALQREGAAVDLGGAYVHRALLDNVRQSVCAMLAEYHEEYPLRAGMPKAELQSRTAAEREFELLLSWLETENVVQVRQGAVGLSAFAPTFSPKLQELRAELEERAKAAGYTLLTVRELVGDEQEKRQVLETMLQTDYLLLDGQFLISRALYQGAVETARELSAHTGSVKLSEFRDRLGTSRRYALLLLERFDKDKLTRRRGEDRIFLA